MTSYNYMNGYSLLSYLEYPIILVQEYILIFLVLKYLNKLNMCFLLYTIVYFTLSSCLLLEIVPKVVLTFLAVSRKIIVFYEQKKIFCNVCYLKCVLIFSPCALRFLLPVRLFNC